MEEGASAQTTQKESVEGVVITLEGKLMEGGSVDWKTLEQIVNSMNGLIRETAHLTRFQPEISHRVSPPREKCFEITLQAVQAIGAALPLAPQMISSIADLVSYVKAFLDLKCQLKGMPIGKENLKPGGNGTTIVNINVGNNITNNITVNAPYEFVSNAIESPTAHRHAYGLAKAVQKDERIDVLKCDFSDKSTFSLPKEEAPYYAYTEQTETQSDELIGRVREIDNKDYKGEFEMTDGDSTLVKFIVEPEDAARIDDIIRELCIVEAEKSLVVLRGEKTFYKSGKKSGKIKFMTVRDIRPMNLSMDV